MRLLLAASWWSQIFRGLAAICLAVIAFTMPAETVAALVLIFGAYAFVDGVMAIIAAYRSSKDQERWAMLLIEGLAGVIAAAVAAMWPGITALVLIYLIGVWAIVTGALEIASAMQLRKYIEGEWFLILSGIASIVFGVLLATMPIAGALAIAVWLGGYWFVFGILNISLGIRLRAWTRNFGPAQSAALGA
jgi:uncharacterized membrane protein HdeD (DUF308 family)